MQIVTEERTSNCCDSKADGEIAPCGSGICHNCKEWAVFEILTEE